MNLLTVVFPEQVIRAICGTLVYSLCWGVLAAVLAGVVLLVAKKMRSAVRYGLLVGILGLFVITTLITFYRQLPVAPAPFSATALPVTGADIQSASSPLAIVAGPMRLVNGVSLFCNQHSALIVLIWSLIIAFQCSRMMIDLRKVHLLTRRQVVAPGDLWNERIVRLSAQLRISVPVRLLQSQIIKVPVTLGHLKPIILVPIGILTAMPQDQVEAVLLHELAHIRRRDYFVNILQRYVEILFFFNPAVWWISSLIKEERENCCDDMVISQTDNRGEYINALVAFQEYTFGLLAIAPAFAGKKGHLLARVKRILYNRNKTMDGREKLLLIAGMAVAGFFFLSSLKARDRVVVHHPAYVARWGEMLIAEPVRSDTVPAGRPKKRTTARPIVEDTAIGSIVQDTAASSEQAQTAILLEKLQAGAMSEQAQNKARAEQAQLKALLENAQINVLLEKTRANTKLEQAQIKALLENAQINVLLEKTRANKLEHEQIERLLEQAQGNGLSEKLQAEKLSELAGVEGDNSLERFIDPIIEDLIQDKVIAKSESTNFSFELNNDGLTVNNVRQPEGLSRKYKEKYVKKPNDYFRYIIKGRNSRTISVSVN
jgi:bla regulator protein BlaR1